MLVPLALLAILAVAGGWIGIPKSLGGADRFGSFLEPVTHAPTPLSYEQVSIAMRTSPTGGIEQPRPEQPTEDASTERILSAISVFAALLGLLLADTLYRRRPGLPQRIVAKSHALYSLVLNKYWVDQIYEYLLVRPLLFLSRYVLWATVDRGAIDGGGAALAGGAQGLGAVLRRVQSGNIRSYAGWLAIGAAAILLLSYFGFGTHHLSLR
jgi:NADH-quinone oxidoreductase subunit L